MRLSFVVAAAVMAAAASAQAGEMLESDRAAMEGRMAPEGGASSRAEVVAELMSARAAGILVAAGESGDTVAVLEAREAFNVAQAREVTARYALQAEEAAAAARIAAMQAAPATPVASADPGRAAAAAVTTEQSLSPGEQVVPPNDGSPKPADDAAAARLFEPVREPQRSDDEPPATRPAPDMVRDKRKD
jgi:hypothetical protein